MRGVVHGEGLLREAVHGRRIGGGVVGAENLFADGLEGVARVRVDVVGLVFEEKAFGVGVGDGERVGLGAGDAVDGGVEALHPAEHVVKGAVLHYQNDDGFDGAWSGMVAEEEKG